MARIDLNANLEGECARLITYKLQERAQMGLNADIQIEGALQMAYR